MRLFLLLLFDDDDKEELPEVDFISRNRRRGTMDKSLLIWRLVVVVVIAVEFVDDGIVFEELILLILGNC